MAMRLEITRKSDLAMRALVVLARSGERQKSAALAEQIGATPGFVPQVISPLVRRGWVSSDPGPTGGYALRVPADSISALDVIESIEGQTDTSTCVLVDRPCSQHGPCTLHVPWSQARDLLLSGLANVSVQELVDREGGHR